MDTMKQINAIDFTHGEYWYNIWQYYMTKLDCMLVIHDFTLI